MVIKSKVRTIIVDFSTIQWRIWKRLLNRLNARIWEPIIEKNLNLVKKEPANPNCQQVNFLTSSFTQL